MFTNRSHVSPLGNGLFNYSNFTQDAVAAIYPHYYSPLYKTIGSLFVSAIFSIGFLGNLMVVLVVWRAKVMHTPTNCYLVSLAIADILLLISAPLPTLIEFFIVVDQWIFGVVGCSMMVFFQFLGVNVSSLSITAFTVERYIAICHPIRSQTICTVSRAMKIILGLWSFGILYCVPWLALTTTRTRVFSDGTTIECCDFKLKRSYYLTYFLTDLVLFYVIPLLVTSILYGLVARILYASRALRGVGGAERYNDAQEHNGTTRVMRVRKSTRNSSRVQVTKMLAMVVCAFALLWLPYRAFVVYNSFASRRYEDLWFLLFCRLMVYTNSAINPILYNAMSVKFRREFKRLLCCGRFRSSYHSGGSEAGGCSSIAPNGRMSGLQTYVQVSQACNTALVEVEMK